MRNGVPKKNKRNLRKGQDCSRKSQPPTKSMKTQGPWNDKPRTGQRTQRGRCYKKGGRMEYAPAHTPISPILTHLLIYLSSHHTLSHIPYLITFISYHFRILSYRLSRYSFVKSYIINTALLVTKRTKSFGRIHLVMRAERTLHHYE